MNAPSTRVTTAVLAAKASTIIAALDANQQALEELLVSLPDADREGMPRTRTQFAEVARTLASTLGTRPDIVAITEYDAAAVIEDLDNVAVIDPLIPRLERLLRMLQDSRLQWLAEAQEPTLAAYTVARTLSKRDGSLTAIIEPMAKVLSNKRAK